MLQVRPRRRGLRAPGAGTKPMKGAVAPWQDLPAEILGLVLLRLPSLADRIHVRAVCRPWRVAGGAQRHLLPPPLPWFAFRDGGLVDLDDAPVRCPHILRDGVLGYLAVDNLALLVHDDGACSLLNPLTGLTIPLPKWPPTVRKVIEDMYGGFDQPSTRYVLIKAVLSSPLGSTPDAIVAILILEGFSVAIFASGQQDSVSIRMSPDLESIWFRPKIDDITFLHGKLYALTQQEGLHVAEVDAGRLSDLKSSLSFRQCIADDPKQQQMYNYDNENDDPVYMVLRYLVESNGKLLLVRRWTGYPHTAMLGDHAKTCRFEISEADLATGTGQWTKVDSLGGQALFLMSSECSKSVLASQCPGGIQEDCVYFMHNFFDNPSAMYMGTSADPLADSGVYNMRDGKITPFLPEDIMERIRSKQQFLTWFFPVDA